MDSFAKADDERDFYLDKQEGFIIFADLNASQEELDKLNSEILNNPQRYTPVPKLTLYETRKFMESFTNEKVYDIDTKEKLLDIIQGRDAREHFLEFLHDHHTELEKWQQFYQERSRIRIIQWLRNHEIKFVFEEDLDVPVPTMEKLKQTIFQGKVSREVAAARKTLEAKSATYYLSEALNPRPKRGRPPKHQQKVEIVPTYTEDFYQTAPSTVRPFLFTPQITTLSQITFSARHDSHEEFAASLRASKREDTSEIDELSRKLASLRSLSAQVADRRTARPAPKKRAAAKKPTPAPKKEEPAPLAKPKPARLRRLIKRKKS